jgi:hypothetical protein
MKENFDKALLAGQRALAGGTIDQFTDEAMEMINDTENLALKLTDVMEGSATDLAKLTQALRTHDYETVAEIFRTRMNLHKSLVNILLGAYAGEKSKLRSGISHLCTIFELNDKIPI